MFPKLSPVRGAGVTAWTMTKATEELERAWQFLVIQIQPVALESEEEEGQTAPVWAPVPGRGAPAASEERHGISHTVDLRDFLEIERRLGLDLMVILKERQQQQKFSLEWELKTAEAAPVWKGNC